MLQRDHSESGIVPDMRACKFSISLGNAAWHLSQLVVNFKRKQLMLLFYWPWDFHCFIFKTGISVA